MKRIRTAVIGTGFMGRVHLEALRRVESVEIVAVAGRQLAAAERLAASFDVRHATDDWRSLLRRDDLDAVHVGTPNSAHFPMVKEALLAGKHVLCEKPISVSVAEARELVALAGERELRNAVCHNLRYYPMVQQMRSMRMAGELGEIVAVEGTYSQDWLLYDTDWNWRVDAEAGGPMRAMADIGSHWFDMAEHLTGLRVASLCADLQTVHAFRKRPLGSVETFAGKFAPPQETEDVPVTTEDFGAVIFRMEGRASGAMTASQVSAGRKNQLRMEIHGTSASVAWDQERPNELWIGHRDAPNEILIKDPALLLPSAASFATLPGGHAEGYADTFKQIFRRFYDSILDPNAEREYPSFADGLRQMQIMGAQLASHQTRRWRAVPQV